MAHHQEAPGNLPELVRADDLPIGLNLSWRLQVLIRSGRLRANDRLPGVRDLASGAAVNVNTARSVYRRLEGEGLAVSEQGLGTFVAPFVSVAPALEELAAQVANEALALGIDPRELAKALYAGSPADDPFSKPIDESPAATRGPMWRNEMLARYSGRRSRDWKQNWPHIPRRGSRARQLHKRQRRLPMSRRSTSSRPFATISSLG